MRPVCPLDAALGLRGIGADDLDAELAQRPLILRRTSVRPIDRSKTRRDRLRQSITLAIGSQQLEDGLRVFRPAEAQHAPAARVIDQHQQRQLLPLRIASFEPIVRTAVELQQRTPFPTPRTSPAMLRALPALFRRLPKTHVQQPTPKRLPMNRKTVLLRKNLGK